MANFNPAFLTTKGLALLAKAQAGQTTITFTKAKTGEGNYLEGDADIPEEQTELKDPKQEFPISTITVTDNTTVYLKFIASNYQDQIGLAEGYHVKEVGIFADDPDEGEILYALAVAVEEQWDYMPAYNNLLPSTITMEFYTTVANASEVYLEAGSGAYVSQEDFEEYKTEMQGVLADMSKNNEVEFDDSPSEIPDPDEAIEQIVSGKSVPVLIGHIKTALRGILNLAQRAMNVALGKNQARVFATVDALDEWLAVPENVEQLKIGDNLYITAIDVPDYWWDGTTKQKLETQKVDLTTYDQQISDLQAADSEIYGNITSLQELMQSFSAAKDAIISSALGGALGMTADTLLADVATILASVANRGKLDWVGIDTTYSVPAGYYTGGTLNSKASYDAGVSAGKGSVTSMQVRDNKAVPYASSGTQNISFSIPANTIANCLVFCDYRTGYTALSESLSSGNFTKNDMQNLQVSVTGGHTYINRLYTISTGASSATFTLTATGAITGMLMY